MMLGRLEQYQRHIDPVPAPGTDTGLELTCSCRDATSLGGPLGATWMFERTLATVAPPAPGHTAWMSFMLLGTVGNKAPA